VEGNTNARFTTSPGRDSREQNATLAWGHSPAAIGQTVLDQQSEEKLLETRPEAQVTRCVESIPPKLLHAYSAF